MSPPRRWLFLAAAIVATVTLTTISLAAPSGTSPASPAPRRNGGATIRRGKLVVLSLPAVTTCARSVREAVARVVGLPGENVAVRSGVVYVNGRRASQRPYLEVVDPDLPKVDVSPQHIPARQYFVLGDARNPACDSRYLGPVPLRLVSQTKFPPTATFEQGYATCASFGPVELGALYGTESPQAVARAVTRGQERSAKRRATAGCLLGLRRHKLGRLTQPHRPVAEND